MTGSCKLSLPVFNKQCCNQMYIKYTCICMLNDRITGMQTSNVILRLDCNKIVGNFGCTSAVIHRRKSLCGVRLLITCSTQQCIKSAITSTTSTCLLFTAVCCLMPTLSCSAKVNYYSYYKSIVRNVICCHYTVANTNG